jgi:hypothetical protein
MQTLPLPDASSVSATQKRIVFVVAAVLFWLCFLTAAMPVYASGGAEVIQTATTLNELLAGMATWHG